MQKTKVLRRIRCYLLIIIGIVMLLGYKLYYYIPKICSNYSKQAKLEKEYEKLLDEENTLSDEIIKLRDEDYIARFAREKYMYSKDGEIIIKINK